MIKNVVLSTRNIDDLISDIANEVVRKIELERGNLQQPPEPSDEVLTAEEAAAYVGVAVPTLYSYTHKNMIPFSKPGGTKHLRFSKLELAEWVKAGRKKTIQEIGEEAETHVTPTRKRRARRA